VDDIGGGFYARVHHRFHGSTRDSVKGELKGVERDWRESGQQAFSTNARLRLMIGMIGALNDHFVVFWSRSSFDTAIVGLWRGLGFAVHIELVVS